MRRKRYAPPTKSSTFGLNITSMTDMFTILLVFLLQSYSTAEIQVLPEEGQRLPLSNSEANPTMAIQVSVTAKELKIENRVIASVQDGHFDKESLDPNDSNFITPLFKELEKMSADEKLKEEKAATDPSIKPNKAVLDGHILVKADSSLSYGTLRQVMYTASMAGFPKMKMATVVGQ
jgi:biopolymer transport protein ExbD